jgi:hypothetical protein
MAGTGHDKQGSGSSGRVLIVAVGAGIVALAAVVILLWPTQEPKSKPTREVQEPAPAKLDWAPPEVQLVAPDEVERPAVAPDAAPPPVPQAETVDLFSGPAPEIIWRGHDIVDKGGRLHSKRVKQVYEFGKEHPDDARPQIILALDSMNRGWYDFAIGHYRKAVEANPDAAKDPRVIRDLLTMSTKKYQAEKAQAAVVDIFGPEALPAVQAKLDDALAAGDDKQAPYLEQLVESLQQLEPK